MHPATKRKRIGPHRIAPAPSWAQDLLDGRGPPERDDPDWLEYSTWLYGHGGNAVPGLPPADSYEAKRLVHAREPVPEWARVYRETGKPPAAPWLEASLQDVLNWHVWRCWARFGAYVPGLPDPRSDEGRELLERGRQGA